MRIIGAVPPAEGRVFRKRWIWGETASPVAHVLIAVLHAVELPCVRIDSVHKEYRRWAECAYKWWRYMRIDLLCDQSSEPWRRWASRGRVMRVYYCGLRASQDLNPSARKKLPVLNPTPDNMYPLGGASDYTPSLLECIILLLNINTTTLANTTQSVINQSGQRPLVA